MKAAFDRWTNNCHKKIINKQFSQIIGLTEDNKDLETMSFNLNRKIAIADSEVKHSATLAMRKVVIRVMTGNLHHYLMKWRDGAIDAREKQEAAQRILKKLRNRIFRLALKKLKRGSAIIGQEMLDERRVREVQARLKIRNRIRIFKAFWNFGVEHGRAKTNLKLLLKHLDKKACRKAYAQWHKVLTKAREHDLFLKEQSLVNQIDESQLVLSDHLDVLNLKQLSNVKVRATLQDQGKKTLQKWMLRGHKGSMRFGFVTWAQKTAKFRHREAVLKNTSLHIDTSMMKSAFARWV